MTTETKEKQERVLTDYKGKEENLFWCPVDSERLKNAFNPPVKCNDKMRAD